jgi:predicted glycogen debranching enzyme
MADAIELSAVDFGRPVCGDLLEAERREWLVTNGIGGYASGTIAGTLTRRYHGLLVASLKPPVERTLLFTKIDERVRYAGGDYDLGANRWQNDYVAPQGWLAIERFYLDGALPVWHYAIGDALLEKRVWMEHGANTAYVRYRALRANSPVTLALRCFVNYRSFHGNTHAGDWHLAVDAVPGGARVTAYEGARPFFIVAGAGAAAIENVWYRDYVLSQETARGLDDRDDNLSAALFTVTLEPGDAVTLIAADHDPSGGFADDALARRADRDQRVLGMWHATDPNVASTTPAWIARCVLAADAFVVRRPIESDPKARSVIAGYHWFGDWGRDTMISLPGLALATGRPDVAKDILLTFSRFVNGGMLPNFFPDAGQTPEYNTVDAALWYVEAAARYVEASRDLTTLRALWPSLKQVIDGYRIGTRYNIHMDADGLIVANAPGVQLTWMDAKVGDWVVTPRAGKPVEIGALWYNALERMSSLAACIEEPDPFAALAERARIGFDRFWNDAATCCFDVIDGPGGNDASLRPNQIFAVSLPHSPLAPQRQRAVVEKCAAELLTSMGLRTLAPGDPRFVAHYGGSQHDRDAAYHQGTVWPWLLGPFATAHLRVFADRAAARSFLEPLREQLTDNGLGTIGEIADGSAPFEARGAIAQAWSIAETLRAWHELA